MNEVSLQPILVEIRQLRKELKTTRDELRISVKTFLTIPETALVIGLKEKTLRNRLSEKIFPVKPLRNGRRVLFRKVGIENYLSSLYLAP